MARRPAVPPLSLAFVVGVVSLGLGRPAVAGLDDATCDPGEACVWQDENYTGCFTDLPVPGLDADWGDGQPDWNNCGGAIEDKVSSYWNRSDQIVVFYTRRGYLGNALCVWPGGRSRDIGGRRLEDAFSSHNNRLPEEQTGPGPPHPGAPPNQAPGPDKCNEKDFD